MVNETEVAGQGAVAPGGSQTDKVQEDGSPADGSGQGQPFLHTWKTHKDADKGVKDLLGQLNDARSRENLAKAQLEQSQQLTAAIEKLGASQAPQGPTEAELQAQRAALEARIDENLDGKTLLGLLDSYMVQAQEGAANLTKKELATLNETVQGLTGRLGDYDPEWQKAAPIVEEFGLREKLGDGADRATLIRVANLLSAAKGPSQPDTPPAPGGTGGQGVSAPDGGVDAAMEQAVQGLVQDVLGRKPTEAQHKRAAKKWSNRT